MNLLIALQVVTVIYMVYNLFYIRRLRRQLEIAKLTPSALKTYAKIQSLMGGGKTRVFVVDDMNCFGVILKTWKCNATGKQVVDSLVMYDGFTKWVNIDPSTIEGTYKEYLQLKDKEIDVKERLLEQEKEQLLQLQAASEIE